MAPKRKRPAEPSSAGSSAIPSDRVAAVGEPSTATRRATRQTPVLPPPVPGSALAPPISAPGGTHSGTVSKSPVRDSGINKPLPASTTAPLQHKTIRAPSTQTAVPLPKIPVSSPPKPTNPVEKPNKRSGRGRPPAHPSPLQKQQSSATITTRTTNALPLASPGTISGAAPVLAPAPARRGAADMGSIVVKENGRPSDLVAPEITYHVPQSNSSHATGRQSSLVRPHGPTAPPPRLDKLQASPVIVTPVPPPKPPTLTPSSQRAPPRPHRNIDKVVLGNLCFRTWYPSYYGKEILGDTSASVKDGLAHGAKDTNKAQSKKDKEPQPMLERLYVCPNCFKYAKELVAWWGHVKLCQQKDFIPGRKVYVHPKGRRTIYIAQDGGKGPGPKKRRVDGGVRYIESVVQDEGEWSIWEVDGETDGLFCQNLSLFAKLFLDNKSVFFDVTGFNYFLLVYTPPATEHAGSSSDAPPPPPPAPQITGFFSKEKMSWDNNNLACILVFPPWQRKGLGALLMGASYEISRREGIMGGPEKPISDLGKKGYKRFWTSEIARWLLNLDLQPTEGTDQQELIVDIEECSRGTWISVDDCLGIFREMGILEDAGMGPGKPTAVEERQSQPPDDERKKKPGSSDDDAKHTPSTSHGATGANEAEEDKLKAKTATKDVPRVRVDKESIRRYVAAQRISLERACDPAGFIEGYAMKTREKTQSADAESREQSQG